MKFTDPTELYKIWILSRILDNIMDLKQNTEGGTRQPTIASVPHSKHNEGQPVSIQTKVII